MKKMILGAAALLVSVGPVPALAHHSFAMFDRTKEVTLSGTVKDFQFTNPHSWIQLVVTAPDGKMEEWAIECLSPNVLGRSGWKKNSMVAGDKVKVLIHPLRDGAHGGNLMTVTLSSGATLGGGAAF